jgi:hypothetical protein
MSVLILNDTDEGGSHFGCQRVMRTIRAELASRGLLDIPSLKVGTNWKSSPEMTALVDAARVVVARWRRTLQAAYDKRMFLRRFPDTTFVANDLEYMERLANRELLVTGRFHAACLAVVTDTPFVAVGSNSWKIEALVADLGLNPRRILPREEIASTTIGDADWSYSADERASIAERLTDWRVRGARLFDTVAALGTPASSA